MIDSPHHTGHHSHDHLKYSFEEIDDNLALLAQSSQAGAEHQAEEYYAQSVGTASVVDFPGHFFLG